uniref:DUF4283 domain-containing protein n=1 Tax=Quercus lobata TaxID=97700 RepID=A0A7N2M4I4_QUELO
MDAVVRTFQPLRHTKENFHITNAGNNILLFAFELEVDAEKVLLREPWSYDRHLVIIQRFNGGRPLKEVEFKHYSFWVQIHDIPFKFMTLEIALEIGETVGSVMVPQDWSEMKRGTFMLIQVRIDVTRPLCHGRRVAFEDGLKGWIAFQYERLPNICFWCGMLSHDDKECELWLKSKGTLSMDHQQLGHWIRASPFSPDFEAIIEELDKDISERQPISNPVVAEIVREINGSNSKTDGNVVVSINMERSVGYSNALKSQDPKNHDFGEANPSFSVGWAKDKVGKKSTKLGKRKNLKGMAGEGKTVDGPSLIKELKRGMWTRLTNKPNMEVMSTNC